MRYIYLAVSIIGIFVAFLSLLVFPRQSLNTDLKGSIETSLSEVKKISSDLDRIETETEKEKRQMTLDDVLASTQSDSVQWVNGIGESPYMNVPIMYEWGQKEITIKVDSMPIRLTDSQSKLDKYSKEQKENRKKFVQRVDFLESAVERLLTESKSSQTNWVAVISLIISFLAMVAQWVPILIKAPGGH